MRSAAKDDYWLQSPDEPEHAPCRCTDAVGTESMNRDAGRELRGYPMDGAGRNHEVKIIFSCVQMTGKRLDDVLGTSAPKVRDEQQDPGTVRGGHISARGGYRNEA